MKFDPHDYPFIYSEWVKIINEIILNERDRKIMKRKLLDNITFEKLAEEVEMSTRQVQRIVDRGLKELIRNI